MQCRNCGAPIRGHECEYCGSWYELSKHEEVRKQNLRSCIEISATGIRIMCLPEDECAKAE